MEGHVSPHPQEPRQDPGSPRARELQTGADIARPPPTSPGAGRAEKIDGAKVKGEPAGASSARQAPDKEAAERPRECEALHGQLYWRC